jgi:hypothetical protein
MRWLRQRGSGRSHRRESDCAIASVLTCFAEAGAEALDHAAQEGHVSLERFGDLGLNEADGLSKPFAGGEEKGFRRVEVSHGLNRAPTAFCGRSRGGKCLFHRFASTIVAARTVVAPGTIGFTTLGATFGEGL